MSETPMEGHSKPQSEGHARPQSEGRSRRQQQQAQRNKKGRVVTYLAILFAAAFFLLLMSYFMQQRANEQAISGLTESLSSIHSLQNLVEVNNQLEAQIGELEQQMEDLTKQAEAMEKQQSQLSERLDGVTKAMDLFWQIDEAYVRGRYGLCRDLIQTMEEGDLKSFLPAQSTTDTDRFSPAERYQEIYNILY